MTTPNNAPARIWLLLHKGVHGAHVWCDNPDPTGTGECEAVEYVRVASAGQPLRRPGRDDKRDAIEAGIEAAAEAMLWSGQLSARERHVAETAARVAVEDLWERMHG